MKTEITEAEFNKRVAAKRKELFRQRVIFVAICFVAIIAVALIVFGFVKLFQNIGKHTGDIRYNTSSVDVKVSDDTEDVYYADELLFIVAESRISCSLDSGSVLWEKKLPGTGKIKSRCVGNYLLAYRFGGSDIAFYGNEGEIFTQTLDGVIDFAAVNENSQKCVVCARKENGSSVVYVFGFKEEHEEGETPVEELLKKTYISSLIVSAAVSDDGKTLAIGELSEMKSVAATKLSLAQIENGKTYFTKIFDNEVLPFLCFDEKNLVAAGGRHVYIVETTKSSSSGQKISTLCEFTGEHNAIISVAVAKGYVAVVGGNESGTTKTHIYKIEDGSERIAQISENPKGVISCGEFFGVYTLSDVKLVGNDGKILGNSEQFAEISKVLGSKTLSLTVKDAVGYTIVRFEK